MVIDAFRQIIHKTMRVKLDKASKEQLKKTSCIETKSSSQIKFKLPLTDLVKSSKLCKDQ